MKVSPSTITAEHWLTLMTCTFCDKTPDNSPVYKCNYGHTVCYPCFQSLVRNESNEIPVCNVCGSDEFTRQDVSSDFLHKLKTKPGIGRPCRYQLNRVHTHAEDAFERSTSRSNSNSSEQVTVEELFQLPKKKLNHLFEECNIEKLRYLDTLSATTSTTPKVPEITSKIQIPPTPSVEGTSSRKPLRCPHDTCQKIIAISSFKSHFKYEHFDFKHFNLTRSKELSFTFDPTVIEHNKSMCMGIINLLPNMNERSREMIRARGGREKENPNFWIMITGSQYDKPNQAYVLFWLFTNDDETNYNCTLELSSQNDMMTMTTLCKVNGIYESQNIEEVEKKLNCLYVTYGTMKSMLNYGAKMKFRLTIH